MSSNARVLLFPQRANSTSLPAETAKELAEVYFSSDFLDREDLDRYLLNPDFLCAACKNLRQQADISPTMVAEESARIHRKLTGSNGTVGLFDEKDFFLGESALIAGMATRHLGRLEEAEDWIERSEFAFRHTINPAPALANSAYARLAVLYERRRYREVADRAPALRETFKRLGMLKEAGKCGILLATALKQAGERQQAYQILDEMTADPTIRGESALLGNVFVELGENLAAMSEFEKAITCFQSAVPLLKSANRPIVLAGLKLVLGDTFRRQGNLAAALVSFRESVADYVSLSMSTFIAYGRVLIAETLLAMHREREAEWEILAALPTIEAENMVTEGRAALLLLRESVQRRSTDRDALRQIREQLQNSA